MGLLTSRRAKIRSHTHARLAQQAREQMEERLSGASGGMSSIYDGRLGASGMEVVQRERRRWLSVHIPTRRLLLLALYSALLLFISSPRLAHSPLFSRLHVPAQSLTAAGSALAAALTMVTGLLIGYRSNQALRKWERGRELWMVQLRSEVRDALRMISLIGPRDQLRRAASRPRLVGRKSSSESTESVEEPVDRATLLDQRSQELLALVVAFVFALQHHLDGTRPTLNVPSADPSAKYPPDLSPVDPLVDLLPVGYIASLRRTPARVRFASDEEEATGSQSDEDEGSGAKQGANSLEVPQQNGSVDSRNGAKHRKSAAGREGSRSPSPRTAAIRARMRSSGAKAHAAGSSSDDGSSARTSALAPARSASVQPQASTPSPASHREISIQLEQLNLPAADFAARQASPRSAEDESVASPPSSRRNRPRNPVLSSRHPRNLPLAVLRLMQSYVDEFARQGEKDKAAESGKTQFFGTEDTSQELLDGIDEDKHHTDDARWGWSASQAEKGWSAVRSFSKILSEAELLSEDPPPLSLSTHLRVLLTLFLASVPLTAIPTLGRGGVLIALVAGWAFWGLEQASEELGGVFGGGANHIPIRAYAYRILDESLRTCPPFKRAYSARVRLRTGIGCDEDVSGDETSRSDGTGAAGSAPGRAARDEWLPSF